MNVRTDHRRTRTGVAAAAIAASVLAATAACAGSSTGGTTTSGGVTTTSGAASPATTTPAGTVSVPAAATSATTAASSATPAAAGSHAAAAGGTAACGNADVKVSLGTGDAAMSHDAQVLKFTNDSSRTCTLKGYPGASVVASGDGRTVLNATRQLNGFVGDERTLSSAPTVSLAPGQSASAVLEWVADAGEKCYPTASGRLLVTPPNTTASTSLRAMTVGSGGVCASFEIHPVVAGVISG